MQKLQFWHYIHNVNVPVYGNFVHDYNKKNSVSDTEFFCFKRDLYLSVSRPSG